MNLNRWRDLSVFLMVQNGQFVYHVQVVTSHVGRHNRLMPGVVWDNGTLCILSIRNKTVSTLNPVKS